MRSDFPGEIGIGFIIQPLWWSFRLKFGNSPQAFLVTGLTGSEVIVRTCEFITSSLYLTLSRTGELGY